MKNRTLVPAVVAGVCCASISYTADLAQMPIVGGQAKMSSPTVAASGTAPVDMSAVQYSKAATVRLLDKQTNRVDVVNLEAGKSLRWAGLTLTLSKCAWGIGGVPVQDAAWFDVTAGSGEPEFHGWMFNTFPGVSTYDHPRYDVALEKCVRPAGYTAPTPARVAPPTPSGPEREGGDDEAPAGGNPGVDSQFVVPGIPGNGSPAPEVPAQPAAPQPAAEGVPQLPVPAAEQPAPEAVEQPEPQAQPQPPSQNDEQQLQRMMDVPSSQ
jgi:hypothetical protein